MTKTHVKAIQAGAMVAQIFEQGEAIIRIGHASVALEPMELRELYVLLSAHYDGQGRQKSNEVQR